MREKIKKLFIKEIIIEKEVPVYKIELDIVVPQYSNKEIFSVPDSVKNFYLFLCSNYIRDLTSGNVQDAKRTERLINDLVVMWEGINFHGLKTVYKIK